MSAQAPDTCPCGITAKGKCFCKERAASLPAAPAPTECTHTCLAAKQDGIGCPQDSCDFEDGTRQPVAALPAEQVPTSIDTPEFRALVEQVTYHDLKHVSFSLLVSHINNHVCAAVAARQAPTVDDAFMVLLPSGEPTHLFFQRVNAENQAKAQGLGSDVIPLSRAARQVVAPEGAKTDLHAAIMNIRCDVPSQYDIDSVRVIYKIGHRDARHAAAELVAASPVVDGAVERDAARYRWLRDKSDPGICAFYLSVGKAFDGVKFKQDTVDCAIDAQISAQEKAS